MSDRPIQGGAAQPIYSSHLIGMPTKGVQAAPPHNIGHDVQHFGFSYNTAQTGTVLHAGTAGIKHVVTDMIFTVEGTGAVTFFDETDAASQWYFFGSFKITAGQTQTLVYSPRVPLISDAAGNNLKLTTTGTIVITGVIHCYEVPA